MAGIVLVLLGLGLLALVGRKTNSYHTGQVRQLENETRRLVAATAARRLAAAQAAEEAAEEAAKEAAKEAARYAAEESVEESVEEAAEQAADKLGPSRLSPRKQGDEHENEDVSEDDILEI